MRYILILRKGFVYRPQWHYDLTKSLNGIELNNKPNIVLQHQDVHSFLTATYVFEHPDGKVGEMCLSQLAVFSNAVAASVPVTMSEIKVKLEGSMKAIVIRHEDSSNSSGKFSYSRVSLTDISTEAGKPLLGGTADLTFSPGQTRVFEFNNLLREAGEASATSATFSIAAELFDLDFVQTFESPVTPSIWWLATSMKKQLVREKATAITILPKPPKMELQLAGFQDQYYTNENLKLQLDVVNGEEVDSVATIDIWLLGESVPSLTLKLLSQGDDGSDNQSEGNSPSGFRIGTIGSAESTSIQILIPPIQVPAIYDLTMKVSYSLVSDMETPIFKSSAIRLTIINPFEANYDFSPLIHPEPWPSFFSHDECGEDEHTIKPHGLSQRWCLTSRYFSFATEDLIVEDLDVDVIGTNGGIQCSSHKPVFPKGGILVSPKNLDEAKFEILTQKVSLDDRGTATLDVSLAIKWRRQEYGSAINTTVLAVPRLLVSNSEPRVLSAVSYSAEVPFMIHFEVTIENPSNHFLTFGVQFEPSERFAFSGVKASTLQLVPLSRRTMTFRLVPFTRGDWIGPVRCVIRDRYFQKILKIAPTEGVRIDKEGIFVWAPPLESEDSL